MRPFSLVSVMLLLLIAGFMLCGQEDQLSENELRAKAIRLAHETIIVDTHIDVPYRLTSSMEDISIRTENGDFDYLRAKKGGLDAPFMSIYVPASYEKKGGGKAFADKLIDMVEKFTTDWPDKFALARSPSDVIKNCRAGKISLPMGMENGTPIERKLENVRYFYDRGIRYITLAHAKNNHICDSSYDTERKWSGLSPFGKKIVAEMNRVGIMIDVSHLSDSAFFQIMALSKAPVIASHSSCRYFTPGWERNMSDEMIKLLGAKGGVIQINFGSSFLRDDMRKNGDREQKAVRKYLKEHHLESNDPKAQEYIKTYRKKHGTVYADISDVVAHIDHVVSLVGVDHVGLGSDFDGVGDSLPVGLKDVSDYPNLIYVLMKKGYSEEEISKICSGNLLRVWSEVERIAEK